MRSRRVPLVIGLVLVAAVAAGVLVAPATAGDSGLGASSPF